MLSSCTLPLLPFLVIILYYSTILILFLKLINFRSAPRHEQRRDRERSERRGAHVRCSLCSTRRLASRGRTCPRCGESVTSQGVDGSREVVEGVRGTSSIVVVRPFDGYRRRRDHAWWLRWTHGEFGRYRDQNSCIVARRSVQFRSCVTDLSVYKLCFVSIMYENYYTVTSNNSTSDYVRNRL